MFRSAPVRLALASFALLASACATPVVDESADASGELVWRLPLHAEYKQLTKGTVADLTNAAAKRKAGTIYAGSFLEEFVEDVPWAHVDIAGPSFNEGSPYGYTPAEGTGAGVWPLVLTGDGRPLRGSSTTGRRGSP